jgi:outer membrane receptor protein involved in Fe transport
MKTTRLKSHGHRRRKLPELLALAVLVAWTSPELRAQATPNPNEDTEEETIVELSPFEVLSTQDKGYAATSSLAGSRLNTDLRDVASAITVVTAEFLKDTGSTNLRDVLVYTTSTEVSGIGGNFYGGNADDNAYRNQMLANPQSGTRVRGLNTADLTRNFFVTSIPMDAYNTSRIDIQRGPNSILFGLGSPAGIINNTLKDPNLQKLEAEAQIRVGSYGSHREMLDVNVPLIKGQLGLRVAGLNDEA